MEFLAILGILYLLLPIITLIMLVQSRNEIVELRTKLERQENLLEQTKQQIGPRLSKLEQEMQKAQAAQATQKAQEREHQVPTPPQHADLEMLATLAPSPTPTPAPIVDLPLIMQTGSTSPLVADNTSSPASAMASELATDKLIVPSTPAPAIELGTEFATELAPDNTKIASPAINADVLLPSATPEPSALAAAAQPSSPAPAVATPLPAPKAPAPTSNSTSNKPAAPSKAATPKTAPAGNDIFSTARAWLFGGNLVAKMGLLILFFGVAFLLKYAAERISTPIEVRLALIAIADIAFLMWAWRIRLSRPEISLPVQGAAMAIMMLVTFGAMRIYHVIPPTLAFFLLFALTAFTCILAVLQNAMWLALFGIAGGFAVPILTSTGSGNHIGLFSYYLLLNFGVLAIALKRSWRPLNLVGLGFTFIIGTAWGVLRYTPADYLSTQAFLIAFFLLYVFIGLLYAMRQPPNLRGMVDGTLVLGTPLMACGLQFSLVQNIHFGIAFSSLALGLFYCGLASVLWRKAISKGQAEYRLLVEALLALGVVFATLTIPMALDARWTSAAWALEGAGIVWLGLRQKRPMTWGFGLLVQFGAWLSFIAKLSDNHHSDNIWLGFLLLAGASFMMACNFRKENQENKAFNPLAVMLLSFATIWLIAGAWVEVFNRSSGIALVNLFVASGIVVFALLVLIAGKMQWLAARALGIILLGVTSLGMLLTMLLENQFNTSQALFDGPFLSTTMLALGALASSLQLQKHSASKFWPNAMLFFGGLWWVGGSMLALASSLSPQFSPVDNRDWAAIALYSACLSLSAIGFSMLARKLDWQQLRMMSLPMWGLFGIVSIALVNFANLQGEIRPSNEWLAYGLLWLGSEVVIAMWARYGWQVHSLALRALHGLRIAVPWLLIWPVGHYWINQWLGNNSTEKELLDAAGWFTSGSWSHYLPAWLMMGTLGALIARSTAQAKPRWPIQPLQHWHLATMIPIALIWSLWLVVYWNFTQNGAMAPLPYLPLLNPLDITSGFAFLLTFIYGQQAPQEYRNALQSRQAVSIFGVAVYAWLNLMLLRSLSHYAGITYQFDTMFASQLVQVVLALVWSISALVLMRRAVKLATRTLWMMGASLLALVVLKLFMVDLSQSGSVERIVSFVGVGLLMVAIGYLAPFPTSAKTGEDVADEAAKNTGNKENA